MEQITKLIAYINSILSICKERQHTTHREITVPAQQARAVRSSAMLRDTVKQANHRRAAEMAAP